MRSIRRTSSTARSTSTKLSASPTKRSKRFFCLAAAQTSPLLPITTSPNRRSPIMPETIASLSLDLDNKWSYMKTHGDPGWESFPSYLEVLVPRVLAFLAQRNLKITFFVVGQDAILESNYAALRDI